ncbi:MAG: hypothetical protein AAF687_00215 [Pseudomonadota bacterium]
MTQHFTDLARRAAADGHVCAQEVLALRRQGWDDGVITRDEAEALFAINNVIGSSDIEWVDFFVEAIVHFVLNGTEPKYQCDDSEAAWLIVQIDHDGMVESMAELEVITRIIERAENVPLRLKDYAIAQIENEVFSGVGPTRCGGELSDAHITSAEANILRRVIFGSGGHGPASVSQSEAEMLFRLKDKTLDSQNAPEWEKLFLDGAANYLKGFTFQNAQLDHSRMKQLEEFMDDNQANVGRFIGRVVREMPQVANNFGKVFGRKQSAPTIAEQADAGEAVTAQENAWLNAMIEKDGELDDLERRLLKRLSEED